MGWAVGIDTKADAEQQSGTRPARGIESYAPASGELLGEAPVVSAAEVRAAVERARVAQRAWAALPVEERCERLLRFRDALVERAEELVDLLSRETGKPRHEALGHELFALADLMTWHAKNAPRILAPREVPLHLLKHRKSVLSYVPRGVIGVISPWNFPLIIPFGDAFAALITGSAVVLKPSEVTPLIALRVKDVWDKSGLPEDLLQVVTGYADTGTALIDAGIQKLIFTGSVATGRKVAAACGERLIPCVLELGGKAPLIACADADLERTARAVVFGGFANSGQACISVERVFAHRTIYQKLVERVTALVAELRQGDGSAGNVDVGAIIFPEQIEIAERHVADALAKGARLLAGGKRRVGPGQFFEPTVLADCTEQMTVMNDEIFGPIVPIMVVDSDERAIELANDSPLGLNAYVFSTDRERAARIAERIESGSVVVNDVFSNYASPEAPFGGVKHSGYGRIHGEDSLRDLAEVKHTSFDRIRPPARDPLWYPYSEKSFRWGLRALRAMFSGQGLIARVRELL
jgi:acyl-CoA reductase-like NAD-dependent aldehyde dehydrogenase